jgi:NCS1 family nucleobase:cation symporter-1
VTNREQATRLEISTIQQIPLDQRHGTAADLFTVWFGSNLMLLTIVTGGLAVTVFHLPFTWAVIALIVGNLVGAVFMALHAAQGPTLGVPQMIQTRGQFGSLGSLLVVGIVIVMYVGFLASNLVLGGEALSTLAPGISDSPGIALVGVLSVVAAIYGHDLIHAYARVMTYVCGLALLLSFAWIIWVHGLPADFLTRNSVSVAGLHGYDFHRGAVADRLRSLRVRLLALHAARHRRAARILGQLLGLHAGVGAADGARAR